MCDVWGVMRDVQDLIFCKIWTLWVKGRPKTKTISVISDPFKDIPKFIQGGSRMYTIFCKASYIWAILKQSVPSEPHCIGKLKEGWSRKSPMLAASLHPHITKHNHTFGLILAHSPETRLFSNYGLVFCS